MQFCLSSPNTLEHIPKCKILNFIRNNYERRPALKPCVSELRLTLILGMVAGY